MGQQGQLWVWAATNRSRPRSVHPFTPHPRQQQRWVWDPHKAQSLGALRMLSPAGPAWSPPQSGSSGTQQRLHRPAGPSLGHGAARGGLRGCGWGTPPGSAGLRRCRAAAPPRCSSPSWSGGSCRCCRSAGHLQGDSGVRDMLGLGTQGAPWGGLGTHKCRPWSR